MRPRLSLRSVLVGVSALAILALVTACGETALDSGVEGEVRIGPINPIEQPGVNNTAPYSARLVVKTVPTGKVVAETTSGADGRFRIFLAPGVYALEPEPGDPLPVATPLEFTVVKGRFTTVNVSYDSGIR